MKSSISSLQTVVLISVLSIILLFGVVSSLYNGYIQIADAKKGRHESKDTTTDSAILSVAQQQQ